MRLLSLIILKYCCIGVCLSQNICGFDNLISTSNQNDVSKLNKRSINDSFVEYQIQVVFHVLHHREEENIKQTEVLKLLDVLNQAYYICNEEIREEFKKVKGCPKIQFQLAQIDPKGDITSGINRIYTTMKTFNKPDLFEFDYPKYSKLGGVDAWDPERYLNIWLCNLSANSIQYRGNLFGYALPPPQMRTWDSSYSPLLSRQGVVLSFQTVSSNVAPFDRVKTIVHEVGHYLGLKHPWGEGYASCSTDDGIEDTPNCSRPSTFCNFDKSTCYHDDESRDMIENYMDYTTDQCKTTFTVLQSKMMISTLINYRSRLFKPISISDLGHFDYIVYPNPFGENLIIISQHNSSFSGILSVELTSLSGEIILNASKISPTDDYMIFSASQISSGLYLLTITNSHQTSTYKVLKK